MKFILKSFLVFYLISISTTIYSQYGLRIMYNQNDFADWNKAIRNTTHSEPDIFDSNIQVGLDYWFRLKNKRIEFMPELFMGLKTKSVFSNGSEASLSYFGFNFNTQIYALDLEGDCDCPTFSKQGPTLKKGLFFSVSPGLIYTNRAYTTLADSTGKTNQINLKIGVGLGYDLGINDFLTISPSVHYNLVFGSDWEDINKLSNAIEQIDSKSGLAQLQFGLRLGFRPDYINKYGRRRR
ncbi:MAG: hypothetical protein V3V14_11915 [Saprospiraceae bacterium]